MTSAWTPRRQAFAWLVLAGCSSAYLWSLFGAPGGNTYFNREGRLFSGEQQAGKRVVFSSSLQNKSAATQRKEIASLQNKIANLNTQLASLTKKEKTLRERVTIIETAFGPSTSALPTEVEQPGRTNRSSTKISHSLPPPEVTVKYSSLPGDGFGDGAISSSPVPIAGGRSVTRTLFGVVLAHGPSAEALDQEWTVLSARHGELLKKLEIRHRQSEAADAENPNDMTLVAGPFANAASASLLCARLNAEGAECKETIFSGENLRTTAQR